MKISETAIQAARQLPPDVLSHPMPYPARLEYAEKLIQEAINREIEAQTLTAPEPLLREAWEHSKETWLRPETVTFIQKLCVRVSQLRKKETP